MVFCGKASLSCKNCRIRRIKCNKATPECSQCVRAGKKCPGYRDQLSLMFRDETSKVRSKFQEITETDGDAEPSSAATSGTSRSYPRGSPRGSSSTEDEDDGLDVDEGHGEEPGTEQSVSAWSQVTPAYTPESRKSSLAAPSQQKQALPRPSQEVVAAAPTLTAVPQATPTERGLRFYIENYILTDSRTVNKADALTDFPWLYAPVTGTLASAVGLSALANLTGDKELKLVSRTNYLAGMQGTGKALTNTRLQDLGATMRGIVLMAMYEIVQGEDESFGTANKHVMGAAAVLRTYVAVLPPSSQPFRSLMQFCYSLLIPCYSAGARVPSVLFEYISYGMKGVIDAERSITDLLVITADFINFSSHVRGQVLVDKMPQTVKTVLQARQLDVRLDAWERRAVISKHWHVDERRSTALPPKACFDGLYHVYTDLPTARIWSYCRWTRILLCELLLELTYRYPMSTEAASQFRMEDDPVYAGGIDDAPVKPEYDGGDCSSETKPGGCATKQLQAYLLATIKRVARDVLVSTPTFWHHPGVAASAYDEVEPPATAFARAGGPSVGLPPMLFHLQVAGCASGVPFAYRKWALDVVETVWAQLGMRQARVIADAMLSYQKTLQRLAGDGLEAR